MEMFTTDKQPESRGSLWIALGIVAVVLLAGAMYVGYDFFFGSKRSAAPPERPIQQVTADDVERDAEELRELLDRIYANARAGNEDKVLDAISALMVPKPTDWFPRVLGEEIGGGLGASYARDATTIRSYLRDTFREIAQRDSQRFETVRLTEENLPRHNVSTKAVPIAIANSLPVFRARLESRPRVMPHLFGYFARDGRDFFYLGRIDSDDNPIPLLSTDLTKTHDVSPHYPESARSKGRGGVIRFDVVLSRSGTVESVTQTEGDNVLGQAAREAVQKWRYRPVQELGESVRVITSVALIYQ